MILKVKITFCFPWLIKYMFVGTHIKHNACKSRTVLLYESIILNNTSTVSVCSVCLEVGDKEIRYVYVLVVSKIYNKVLLSS